MLQSPFDALVLSVPVISLGVINTFAFDGEIYAKLLPALLIIFGTVVLATFVATALAWISARGKRVRSFRKGWLAKVAAKPDLNRDSFGLMMLRALSSTVLWAVALPIGTFLTLILLGTACLIVAFIPMLGIEVGRTYLHTYVIAPEACIPVRNSAIHMEREAMREKGAKPQSRPGTTCVRVVSNDGAIFAGRVALSTSSAILLYDPATGIARHIPTGDAIIESIDVIPPAADPRSDAAT